MFVSSMDGWPHLYSVPATGGDPLLLTPGKFMVEFVKVSPDRRWIVSNANTGPDASDDDRATSSASRSTPPSRSS